jgi:lactoylglutathione lyase
MIKVAAMLVASAVILLQGSAAVAQDRLGAMGIGVADLAASTDFYKDVLGLQVQRTYELGYLNEIVLGYAQADSAQAVVVLMNWPEQSRSYDGSNVKLVFYIADPVGAIERIRERGGEVLREATPIEALNGRVVGLARDPDNYVVEVIAR